MIAKFLIDTNILMDIIFEREPFLRESKYALKSIFRSNSEVYVSVQSLSDIFYLTTKNKSKKRAWETLEKISLMFNVIGITPDDSIEVLSSGFDDYEDGVIAFSAKRNGIDAIVTRNDRDFYESDLFIIDPKEIDKYLNNHCEVGSIVVG
ncbi:MAG: PIN domain-containing protein [Methanomassiliicoccaceae archaeon]|nr:PIN domain-containing protein [Methanomassiliicoccaceae archaeon]